MKLNKVLDLSLYLVLDPILTEKIGMAETARLAVEGGATVVQLRAPQWKKRARYECALELKKVLEPYHIPLIIDDDVDVALACDADGVHVGQQDLPAHVAGQLLGQGKIIGLSVNNADQMKSVDPSIVNYVGVGPIFATSTKPDAQAPIGVNGLEQLMRICPVPAVAIGGIKSEHIEHIVKAGAQGVAVVSAICGQDQPKECAQNLSSLWKLHSESK